MKALTKFESEIDSMVLTTSILQFLDFCNRNHFSFFFTEFSGILVFFYVFQKVSKNINIYIISCIFVCIQILLS